MFANRSLARSYRMCAVCSVHGVGMRLETIYAPQSALHTRSMLFFVIRLYFEFEPNDWNWIHSIFMRFFLLSFVPSNVWMCVCVCLYTRQDIILSPIRFRCDIFFLRCNYSQSQINLQQSAARNAAYMLLCRVPTTVPSMALQHTKYSMCIKGE